MAAASEMEENPDKNNTSDETEVQSTENKTMKLEELKVADLKNELEKRSLDKNGVKSVLIERLKSAMLKNGEDPNEYVFEVPSDVTESSIKEKKNELSCANGNVECSNEITNEETNSHEEKQEVALQLSIDEEEAQLNDEESLIEPTKSTTENKLDNAEEMDCELIVNEKIVAVEDNESTSTKVLKTVSEDAKEKKIVKMPVQNKSTDELSTVFPKVLKVVGKNEKLKSTNFLAKSLCVRGIPNTTRAADLKALFSKQGRVISVKIIKTSTLLLSKCHGLVTMATSKDAIKAIQNLHQTELAGCIITVEKAKNETGSLLKKSESKILTLTTKKQSAKKGITSKKTANEASTSVSANKDVKLETKVTGSKKSGVEGSVKKKDEKVSAAEKSKSKDRDKKLRENRGKDLHRSLRRPLTFRPRPFGFNERARYGGFRRPFGRPFLGGIGFGSSYRSRSSVMTMQKLRDERFQRERFRERREVERRRDDELSRHRYIERKQREEAYRLEREKERLRIERELLERERAEMLKLEREKQRLERERLECEREELRRQADLRSSKRPFNRVDRETESVWDERKKSASRYDGRSSFHADITGSRFEFHSRDRINLAREFVRHPDRFTQKHMDTVPRPDFGDRDARREVTIRSRDERQVFTRNDRDHRRFSSHERERHSSRREDWKHDRRVHERIVSPSSSSTQRRMTYY